MSISSSEIDAHFVRFQGEWPAELAASVAELRADSHFRDSYRRLCALTGWRNDVVAKVVPPDALQFFIEAHNDAIISHVFAHCGAWRSALQALRSTLENVLQGAYYMDHPVEMQQWHSGDHRLGFSELHSYFIHHPLIAVHPEGVTGLTTIKTEYATLSRAVHGSAVNFRMTASTSSVTLFKPDTAQAGMWSTRERHVIESLSLLLACLFSSKVSGTQNRNLRSLLAYCFGKRSRELVKQHLKIVVPEP